MPSDTLEIEAESLEEAREAVKSRIPAGLSLLSEEIISDGSPKTATAAAATCEAAAEQARGPNPRPRAGRDPTVPR